MTTFIKHPKRVVLSTVLTLSIFFSCIAAVFGSAATQSYTVTLDAGRGYFTKNGQQVKTITENYSDVREIMYDADPEQQYYSGIPSAPGNSELLFIKWCTSPDLSESSELPEGYKIDSDITLYAKYQDIYTVTIDSQDKNLDPMAPMPTKDFKVKQGETIDLSFRVYNCNGVVPYGVFENRDGTGLNYATSYTFSYQDPYDFIIHDYKATKSQTLYVCYCNPITVTFDANGGIFSSKQSQLEQKRAPGLKIHQEVAIGDDPSKVSREGCVLVGWNTNKDAIDGVSADDIIAESDMTYYAIWKSDSDSSDIEYDLPDGLHKIGDDWLYIRNKIIAEDFSGLVKHEDEYWYVENGKVNFNYTGLINSNDIEGYTDIHWYWVTNGVFDKTHTAVEPYLDRGSYLVENGYIDFHKTGIYYDSKTDRWVKITNGKLDLNDNSISSNQYGWWKTTDGVVTFKENGVFQNSYGWWRVKDSKVDFKAQGIYQNQYGWWKTTDGKVTFKENGVFQNEFGWWKVKDSKVDFGYTGVAQNNYGWWRIENGKVNFKANGLFSNEYGTWYVKNGKVDFGFNGSYQGKTIKNGKVVSGGASAANTSSTNKSTNTNASSSSSFHYSGKVRVSKNGIYHRETGACPSGQRMKNYTTYSSPAAAEKAGFRACHDCNW